MEDIKNYKNALLRQLISNDPNIIKMVQSFKLELKMTAGLGFATTTDNVKPKLLKLLIKPFEDCLGEPVKIDIVGIGVIRNCHGNVRTFCEINDNYTEQLGYNILACECGGTMEMEIHSVIKNKKDGKLYDITEDYGGEKSKWFVPILHDKPNRIQLRIAGNRLDFYTKKVKKCNCGLVNTIEPFEPQELSNVRSILHRCSIIMA